MFFCPAQQHRPPPPQTEMNRSTGICMAGTRPNFINPVSEPLNCLEMEMYDVLPAIVKTLMIISMGGLFLSMLFVEKIRLNGKEKGGRNIVITLVASLVATLFFSTITTFFLYENVGFSLSSELMPVEAIIFSFLTILSFMPVLVALFKIGALLARRKQL
jgi:hypothetical protein